MSLDRTKLENLKEKGGNWIARCPACAKSGGDTKGEHLFIASDGKFGCVAHPDDPAHRKEIFQLVGIKSSSGQRAPIPIRIRRPACVTRKPKTILKLESLTMPTPPPSRVSEEPVQENQPAKPTPENNVPGDPAPVLLSDPAIAQGATGESISAPMDDMGHVVSLLGVRQSLRDESLV